MVFLLCAEGRTTREKGRSFIRRQKKAKKEAEELFLKGDYKSVIKVCDDILYLSDRYKSKKRYVDELYYLAGVSCLKSGDLVKAEAYLSSLISECKKSHLIDDAYLALAEVFFIDEDYKNATELLTYYTKAYPKESSLPQAYLRLGQIAQKSGRWNEARSYFDKIEKDFPLSFEAELMPSLGDEEDFFFTVQLGSFNNLKNARKLKKALEANGYSPYIVEVRSSNSTFYRVRVGRLNSRSEAMRLANTLESQGFSAKVYP